MKTIRVQNGILPLTPAGLESDGCVRIKILVEKRGNRVKTLGRQPAGIQSAPAGIAPFKISNPMKKPALNFPKLFSALLLFCARALNVSTARAQFTAAVSGTSPISLQWYFNNAPLADGGRISGVTNLIFNLANVTRMTAEIIFSSRPTGLA